MAWQDTWGGIVNDPEWASLPNNIKSKVTRNFAKKVVAPEVGGLNTDAGRQFIQDNIIAKTTKTQAPSQALTPLETASDVINSALSGTDNTLVNQAADATYNLGAKGVNAIARKLGAKQDVLHSTQQQDQRLGQRYQPATGFGQAVKGAVGMAGDLATTFPVAEAGVVAALPGVAGKGILPTIARNALTFGAHEAVKNPLEQLNQTGTVDLGQVGQATLGSAATGAALGAASPIAGEAPGILGLLRRAAVNDAAMTAAGVPFGGKFDVNTLAANALPTLAFDGIAHAQGGTQPSQTASKPVANPGAPDFLKDFMQLDVQQVQQAGSSTPQSANPTAAARATVLPVDKLVQFRDQLLDKYQQNQDPRHLAAAQTIDHELDRRGFNQATYAVDQTIQPILDAYQTQASAPLALAESSSIAVPPGGFQAPGPDGLTAQAPHVDMTARTSQPAPLQIPERVPVNVPPGGFQAPRQTPDGLMAQAPHVDMTRQAPPQPPLQLPERVPVNVPPGGFRAPGPDALTGAFPRQEAAPAVPEQPRIAGLLPERVPDRPIQVPAGGFRDPDAAFVRQHGSQPINHREVLNEINFLYDLAANTGKQDVMRLVEQSAEALSRQDGDKAIQYLQQAREAVNPSPAVVEATPTVAAKGKKGKGAKLKVEAIAEHYANKRGEEEAAAAEALHQKLVDQAQAGYEQAVQNRDVAAATHFAGVAHDLEQAGSLSTLRQIEQSLGRGPKGSAEGLRGSQSGHFDPVGIAESLGKKTEDATHLFLRTAMEASKRISENVGGALQKMGAASDFARNEGDKWKRYLFDGLTPEQQRLMGRYIVHENGMAIQDRDAQLKQQGAQDLTRLAKEIKDNRKAVANARKINDPQMVNKLLRQGKALVREAKLAKANAALDPRTQRIPLLGAQDLATVAKDAQIQAALDKYRKDFLPLVDAMHRYLGVKGKRQTATGLYMRMKAIRDGDQAVHGINVDNPNNPITGTVPQPKQPAGSTAARQRLQGTGAAKRASGMGHAYETDLGALVDNVFSQDMFNFQRKRFLEAAQKEGLASDKPEDIRAKGYRPAAIEFNAPHIETVDEKTGEVNHVGQWKRTYYVPEEIAHDYKWLTEDKQGLASKGSFDLMGKANNLATQVQLNLVPAEATTHLYQELSALSKLPVASDKMGMALKYLAPIIGHPTQALREVMNVGPQDAHILQLLQERGVISARALGAAGGERNFDWMNKLGKWAEGNNATHAIAKMIESPKDFVFGMPDLNATGLGRLYGFDARAKIAGYKLQKMLNPEVSDAKAADFALQFGNMASGIQSRMVSKGKSFASFLGTQSQLIPTALGRMVGYHGMDASNLPQGQQMLLNLGTLHAGIISLAINTVLLNYAFTHKMPWEHKGLKFGEVRLTEHGPDGKPLDIPLQVMDPMLGRALRWSGIRAAVEAVRHGGDLTDKASVFASEAGRDAVNNAFSLASPAIKDAVRLTGNEAFISRKGQLQRAVPDYQDLTKQIPANVAFALAGANGAVGTAANAVLPFMGKTIADNPFYPKDPVANAAMRVWDTLSPVKVIQGKDDAEVEALDQKRIGERLRQRYKTR